jgi:hypothetical protein
MLVNFSIRRSDQFFRTIKGRMSARWPLTAATIASDIIWVRAPTPWRLRNGLLTATVLGRLAEQAAAAQVVRR